MAQGPRGSLLLGNMQEYMADPLAFMTRMPRRYGPVYKVRFLHVPYFVVSHPDGIKQILHDNARNYRKNPQIIHPLEASVGTGLLVSEGESHLRQRRLMQPLFHRQQIMTIGDLMSRETEAVLASWDLAAREGKAVDVAAAMKGLALNIVTRALFSTSIEGMTAAFTTALATLNADAHKRTFNPLYPPPAIPTLHNRRLLAARRQMDRFIYKMIAERRAGDVKSPDLLSLLIQARDPVTGAQMSDRQIHDESLTLIAAGQDTTANALSWTFYVLARHPEVEARLHAELAAVLNGRPPSAQDLPALPYSRMIIDEVLRLCPPVPLDGRRAIGRDVLCGYDIPPNANVDLAIYAVHRHPEFWEKPAVFDPDRFAPGRAAGRHRFAYIPFFAGQHMCLGKDFGLVEAQLVLATIAQRYRLALAPGRPVIPQLTLTMGPRGGLPMILRPR
jgi:cytochrome P450